MKTASTLVQYFGPGADAADKLNVRNSSKAINSENVKKFAATILAEADDQLDALHQENDAKKAG